MASGAPRYSPLTPPARASGICELPAPHQRIWGEFNNLCTRPARSGGQKTDRWPRGISPFAAGAKRPSSVGAWTDILAMYLAGYPPRPERRRSIYRCAAACAWGAEGAHAVPAENNPAPVPPPPPGGLLWAVRHRGVEVVTNIVIIGKYVSKNIPRRPCERDPGPL